MGFGGEGEAVCLLLLFVVAVVVAVVVAAVAMLLLRNYSMSRWTRLYIPVRYIPVRTINSIKRRRVLRCLARRAPIAPRSAIRTPTRPYTSGTRPRVQLRPSGKARPNFCSILASIYPLTTRGPRAGLARSGHQNSLSIQLQPRQHPPLLRRLRLARLDCLQP